MKRRIQQFLEECPVILASCPRTQRSVLATELVPGLILFFGGLVTSRIELLPPFDGFEAPLREGFFLVFCGVAAVAFVSLATLTVGNYARARARLYR